MAIKKGDRIQVRNLDSGEWVNATVEAVKLKDETIRAKVEHPGHALHGKTLTVDAEHYREVPEAEG